MSSTERPVITNLERSTLDIALEVVAAVFLLVLCGMVAFDYSRIPDSVPSHFNGAGQPDQWAGRAFMLFLPLTGLFVYGVMTLVQRSPQKFNYPLTITAANARTQYALARQLLIVMKALCLITFTYISWVQLETARGVRHGLGAWFVPLQLLLTAGIVLAYFAQARRAR